VRPQAEVRLLHSQLAFEQGRREVLGARNRRLLGVSKGVRELEEQKRSLEDRLVVARGEVATLQGQLAVVRQGKHQTEEERAEYGRQQEAAIQRLQRRADQVEQERAAAEGRATEQEERARRAAGLCDAARGELFQARARLEVLGTREAAWGEAAREAEELRKQVALQGELVERYRERLEQLPVAGRAEEMRIIQDAAKHEVAAARAELVSRLQELTASQARALELEGRAAALEQAVRGQQELVVTVQDEMGERVRVVEDRWAGAARCLYSNTAPG
jgi:chromosome segregation ATPase